jgi:hypothetical protein
MPKWSVCVKVQSFWLVKHVVHIPLSIKALADISCTGFVELKQSVHIFQSSDHVNIKDNFIIKPTRCTNFSNLFLEWNSTYFREFLCPSSGVFHCTHSNGICHTGLLTACEQDVPSCPKHVEFYFKNKVDKLVHLVGCIIKNLSQCRVTWMSYSSKMNWEECSIMSLCFVSIYLFNTTVSTAHVM